MKRVGETQINNFGSTMIIISYRNNRDVDIYFPEYDWTAEHKTYQDFKKGKVGSPYEPRVCNIGYIGEGEYKATENRKATKQYAVWHDMLHRCYNPKCQEKNPTYIGCSVCDEWHNFQAFCKWYEDNYYEIPGEQIALDKDILIKGNKIYGPETCMFVPTSINSLFVKSDNIRGNLPIGVYYNKQNKKYQAMCRIGTGKSKYLGLYDTSEAAFQAYKEFKEAYIKKVANDYIEDIPFELYRAMINYEVDIDD